MKEYQVTLICADGTYKPVSCIIKTVSTDTKEIKNKGITKICQKRGWGKFELLKYGYTKIKIREYDKEKIAKENAERYEKIKEEKYASGEWKKPKKEG